MAKRKITPLEEEHITLENLLAAKKSKMKAIKYFALEKIEAYEDAILLPSGIRIYKNKCTNNTAIQKGQKLTVKYQGYLTGGRKIDSGTITFELGDSRFIKGWEYTLLEMNLGESCTTFIPSSAAYGKNGSGKDIKPFTTLIFDLEVLEIK